MKEQGKKYKAFISYSHSDCGKLAPAIQKAIEHIGKPWYRIGRNLTVFRDETNLSASPELWNSIVQALEASESFILLASPLSAKSYWIEKEVSTWLLNNLDAGKIYIVLAEGNIAWDNKVNDFDWNETNCLPDVLSGKFTQEPHWIDLRDYINLSNRSVNYKEAGFSLAMTKIIGGITGKAPRDIESAELQRNRKAISFILFTAVIFIAILVAGLFFFRENNINNRNALVNRLIAEANKLRETDMNKALLLYGYAYKINRSDIMYQQLKDYYSSHVFIDTALVTETDPSATSAFKEAVDTINTFYYKIKAAGTPVDIPMDIDNEIVYNMEISPQDSAVYFPMIFMNLAANQYYYYDKSGFIVSKSLQTDVKQDSFALDITNLSQLFGNPRSYYLGALFYNSKDHYRDSTFVLYDLKAAHKNLYTIFGNEYPRFREYGSGFTLSANSTILARLIHPIQFEPLQNNLVLYNLFTKKEKVYSLNLELLYGEYFNTRDMKLSNNSRYLYLCVSGGSDGYSVNSILDIETNREIVLAKGSATSNGQNRSLVAQFLWGKNDAYFIYATGDGHIHYVDIEVLEYFEQNDNTGLQKDVMDSGEDINNEEVNSIQFGFRAMEQCDKYIFCGLADGQVTGYRNPARKKDNWARKYPLEKAFSFRLNTVSSIASLDYDEKKNSLYITTVNGEIYCCRLSHYISLTHDPDKIIDQLTNELGIEDLNKKERIFFNIN